MPPMSKRRHTRKSYSTCSNSEMFSEPDYTHYDTWRESVAFLMTDPSIMSTLQNDSEKPSSYLHKLQVILSTAIRRGGIAEEEINQWQLSVFLFCFFWHHSASGSASCCCVSVNTLTLAGIWFECRSPAYDAHHAQRNTVKSFKVVVMAIGIFLCRAESDLSPRVSRDWNWSAHISASGSKYDKHAPDPHWRQLTRCPLLKLHWEEHSPSSVST